MSAGNFTLSFYATNASFIAPARIQPETLLATFGSGPNATPGGPATAGIPRIIISKSRKAYGIHPRTVTVRFTATPPTGYALGQTYTIPVLTQGAWDAVTDGATGTYLGVATVVVSKAPEIVK